MVDERTVPAGDLVTGDGAWIAGELHLLATVTEPEREVAGHAMSPSSVDWCITRVLCDSWVWAGCQ